jgi:hypothetical protein
MDLARFDATREGTDLLSASLDVALECSIAAW